MEAAIRRCTGGGSPDDLLTSRRPGHWYLGSRVERVFQVIGAIIYEMEWMSGHDGAGTNEPDFQNAEVLADAADTISPDFPRRWFEMDRFFQLMLAADYGFEDYPIFAMEFGITLYDKENTMWAFGRFCGFLAATAWRWRQGHAVPDQKAWDLILDVLAEQQFMGWGINRNYPWEAAVMLYRYHSRRMPLGPWRRREGWTGYQGGLVAEMVAEIPTRGNTRLERKLALDVHGLIPLLHDTYFISRIKLNHTACDLATRHGCRLRSAHRVEPAVPKPSWLEWFYAFLGFSPRVKLEDEESRGEKEKLMEGREKDEDNGEGGQRPYRQSR